MKTSTVDIPTGLRSTESPIKNFKEDNVQTTVVVCRSYSYDTDLPRGDMAYNFNEEAGSLFTFLKSQYPSESR
ncbi:hypothetical protein E4U40_006564 [Claviceps sp. LM458 group G5]|nr:hypothetical protein E4U40_006564 [Claviceps sp. LM458 group G5]